jgi:hypothetical protein
LGRLGAPAAQPKPQRAWPTGDLSLARPSRRLSRLRSPPTTCVPGLLRSRAPAPPTARAHQPPQQPHPRRRIKEIGLLSPLLNPKLLSRSTPCSENRIVDLELARSSSAPVEVNPPSPFPFPPPFFFVAVRFLAFVVVRGSPMAASATSAVRGSPMAAGVCSAVRSLPGTACPRHVAPAWRACCLARASSLRVARRARGAAWHGYGLVRTPPSPRDDPRPSMVWPSASARPLPAPAWSLPARGGAPAQPWCAAPCLGPALARRLSALSAAGPRPSPCARPWLARGGARPKLAARCTSYAARCARRGRPWRAQSGCSRLAPDATCSLRAARGPGTRGQLDSLLNQRDQARGNPMRRGMWRCSRDDTHVLVPFL